MATPLSLPEPKSVVFGKSPLSLVVCQLRFEHLGDVERHLDALRERLAEHYPLSQKLQTTEVQVSGVGAQTSTTTGLRFSSVEADWTLTLMPDFCSLETTNYGDWAGFEERLREALLALIETAKPRVETRLGLRYVNQLQLDAVKEPSDWTQFLEPSIVGDLSADAPLAASALTLHQMMQLDIGDDARLTFRHGLPGETAGGETGSLMYLLDFDCFRQNETAQVLDIDGVVAEADRFNTVITSLFQWCLREPLWKELEPHDK